MLVEKVLPVMPPGQATVPPVQPLAVSVTDPAAQTEAEAVTPKPTRTVLLSTTTLLLIAVQPLVAVAVTEYVPAPFTVMLVAVAPVLHSRPVTDAVAMSVRLVWAQVSVPLVGLMLTVGREASLAMLVLCPTVQPLAAVTSTE